MKQDKLKAAAEQFERSLIYDKKNPYTLYNLAQVYYRLQKLSKAEKHLKRAHNLKPSLKGLRDLYQKVRSETRDETKFDKIETMHFIIASAPDLPVEQLSYIRTYLEEAYGRIGMFLNHYSKSKTVVILYSESNYKKLLENKPHWMMAIFDGKVRIPVDKAGYPGQEIIQIIYHEYAHVVLHDLVNYNLPLWLSEGIASYAEDFVYKKDKSFYRNYIEELGVIDITKMPSNFAGKNLKIATWLYVQSYLLVEFIAKRKGYSGLQNILNYLSSGKNYFEAIEQVFGKNTINFQKDWERFIERSYGVRELEVWGQ